MYDFLRKYWKGEEKLWKVFWIWTLIPHVIFHFLQESIGETSGGVNLILLMWIPFGIYAVWILISLWRCSPNVGWSGFKVLARIFVILEGFIFGIVLLFTTYMWLIFKVVPTLDIQSGAQLQ